MANRRIENLRKELEDPEFAKYYGADQARVRLALTLYAARNALKLTQYDLAQRLGASQPYIAKLERGDANPTIGRIGSLLATMGLRLVTTVEPLLPEEPVAEAIAADAGSVVFFAPVEAGGAWAGETADANVPMPMRRVEAATT